MSRKKKQEVFRACTPCMSRSAARPAGEQGGKTWLYRDFIFITFLNICQEIKKKEGEVWDIPNIPYPERAEYFGNIRGLRPKNCWASS